jgi:hypothetical protein
MRGKPKPNIPSRSQKKATGIYLNHEMQTNEDMYLTSRGVKAGYRLFVTKSKVKKRYESK